MVSVKAADRIRADVKDDVFFSPVTKWFHHLLLEMLPFAMATSPPPPSQGEWRIAVGCCTCYGVELMPESMPGWPISKKEIKDPVPSTNDGWGSREGGSFFCVCFLLSFLPPSVLFYSLTLSVNLVSTAKLRRNNKWGLLDWKQWDFSGCVCLCSFMYVCVAVCVCVSLVCGTKMS